MHSSTLQQRLREAAHRMNDGGGDAQTVLQWLSQEGYLQQGVPRAYGGSGSRLWEAVQAIAEVSQECLTSGFLFWCQRVFIEYLLHTDNEPLRDSLLPDMLAARRAGATGLSNAMKHLGGLEPLRTRATLLEDGVALDGFLPWASNLQPRRFVVAVAAQVDEQRALVAAVPAEADGVQRSDDLQLLGLQSSQTATLTLQRVHLPRRWLLGDNAHEFLSRVRPGFLLLQCGLPMGVAQRALQEAQANMQSAKRVLQHRADALCQQWQALSEHTHALSVQAPLPASVMPELFQTRIRWVRMAVQAVQLELEATGGAAFLRDSDTARRLREVSFLPVLTPSATQLALQLQQVGWTE
ncbi:MAG: acyl-CoA dehydrogenase family protein [Armatimonadota bacterium]|nr:acyl-CoA dehydrogenase family protein [Armatimonadota bacterium]